MEQIILITFWSSLAILFYTYVGYGGLVWLLAYNTKRKETDMPKDWPEITILIAAYNEATIIEEKILNTLELVYPPLKKKIWIVTDGSDDATPAIVRSYKGIRLFHEAERKGKVNAVNRVMKEIDTPIVVFSDANTFINADGLLDMVKHFADPGVGGVAGEKRIAKQNTDNASGSGEGLYWRYESFLKQKDSDLHSVQGAAGEFFAIRTSLFAAPPSNIIIEDFYLSMQIIARGYRFVYEPNACATETASSSISEEWKRKVRISAGGLQAVIKLKRLLNPFRFGVTSFQYFSHRVIRWTLGPLSLLIALVSNILLAVIYKLPAYTLLLEAQGALYGAALIGFLLRERKTVLKVFFVPFYFLMMNLAVYAGFVRIVRGRQSVVWEKARRKSTVT